MSCVSTNEVSWREQVASSKCNIQFPDNYNAFFIIQKPLEDFTEMKGSLLHVVLVYYLSAFSTPEL